MAAALPDRLLHHCHIVNIRGNGYRKRDRRNLARALHQAPARKNPAPRSGEDEEVTPRGAERVWRGTPLAPLPPSAPDALAGRYRTPRESPPRVPKASSFQIPLTNGPTEPALTAGGQTQAAFERRCIPAKQPVMKPTRRSAGDPSRLNRIAARRSSLRFGRNTLGIPPSRALSAGRLAGLGAHVGSTTGCSPLRFAPFCVAFRSKYTRYSSLTRLVSRAPRPHRENWPLSALTRVPPQAVNTGRRGSACLRAHSANSGR